MMVESPCFDVCTLDRTGEYCLGCMRTMQEIKSWSEMSDQEKTQVIEKLEQRRKKWVLG